MFNIYFPGLAGKMADAMKLFDTNDDQKIEFEEFVQGGEMLFAQKAPKMHALASRSKGLSDLDAALKGFLKDETAQKKAVSWDRSLQRRPEVSMTMLTNLL